MFHIKVSILLMLLGVVLFVDGVDTISSKSGFCISCHPMNRFHALRKESPHLSIEHEQIHCNQCHLPTTFFKAKSYKIKRGAHDVYAALTSKNLTVEAVADHAENRSEYVFKDACVKCHRAGIFKSTLPEGVADIHRHAASQVNKMHCVDCHGGMEHGLKPMFNWPNIQKFIAQERVDFSEELSVLTDVVVKTCLPCHLEKSSQAGFFRKLGKKIKPVDYLLLKVGVEHYNMPPSSTLRAYALDALRGLEVAIEENQ